MRKHLFVLSLLVLGFVAHRQWNDPLARLDREARKTPYLEASYRPTRGNSQYWNVLRLQATLSVMNGATVEFVALHHNAGQTNPRTREIQIDEDLSWNSRLEVLAHEAGHLLQPNGLDQAEGEAFAEAVAFLVCRSFGMDNVWQHAHYLSAYKGGLHVIREFDSDIRRAARVLGQ